MSQFPNPKDSRVSGGQVCQRKPSECICSKHLSWHAKNKIGRTTESALHAPSTMHLWAELRGNVRWSRSPLGYYLILRVHRRKQFVPSSNWALANCCQIQWIHVFFLKFSGFNNSESIPWMNTIVGVIIFFFCYYSILYILYVTIFIIMKYIFYVLQYYYVRLL